MDLREKKEKGSAHCCHKCFSGNLFKCLQAPLQDLRTWLRPSATSATPTSRRQRTSSPLADQEISFIDDSSVDSSAGGSNGSNSSTTSSNSASDDEAYPSTPVAEISLSSANSSAPATARAFSSDSGFVSASNLSTTARQPMF